MIFRGNQIRNAHLNRARAFDLGLFTATDDGSTSAITTSSESSTTKTSVTGNPVVDKPPASTNTSTSTSTTVDSSSPPPTSTASSSSTTTTTTTSAVSTNTLVSSTTPPGTTEAVSETSNTSSTPTTYTSTSTIKYSSVGSASASSSPTPSGTSSGNTGTYIGYAAAGVLGFAVLVAVIMFFMRRLNKRRENEALGDVFDHHSFVRDSVAIPDGPSAGDDPMAERGRPRPPTMIDRHIRNVNDFNGGSGFGGPAPMPSLDHSSNGHGGYYGNGNGNGYEGYNPQGAYDQYGNLGYHDAHNGQFDQYAQYGAQQGGYQHFQDSPVDAYGHQADHTYFNHHATGSGDYAQPEYPAIPAPVAGSPTTEVGRSLTRQPSSKVAGVDYPNVAELGRGTSVTPYQAAQYAEISKQLDNPNGHPSSDATQAYATLSRQPSSAAYHAAAARPHTEYEEEDAYAGI